MLAVAEGPGGCWSECSWSRVDPTRHSAVNTTARQAKYMVRSVSWWTWTALASAWWSRPLLCPEVWLPSALRGQGDTGSAAVNAARGRAPRTPGDTADEGQRRCRRPGQSAPDAGTPPFVSRSEQRSCRRRSQKWPPCRATCSRERPAAHSPVMFFIHQVVPGPEGHQVSVVCWCRDGHGARAAHVGVTQLVGEDLQLVRGEAVVVPEHVIVGGPARPLGADQRVRGTPRPRRPHPGARALLKGRGGRNDRN